MNKVLVLSHSAGFKHNYIPEAVKVIKLLGKQSGLFEVHATEDCEVLNEEALKKYAAILFVTTGELPISDQQKKAFIDVIKNGKGFIGIHNATDTFHKFAEYGRMLGGYFSGHPWTQEVIMKVEDQNHPATKHLPKSFSVKEEIYTFEEWNRDLTHVLISLDNSSVDLSKGNRRDNDYAFSWCHLYGKGRIFYTGFGHFIELWKEIWFRTHLLNGILWVMKINE